MLNWRRNGLLYIVIVMAGVAFATIFLSSPGKPTEIPLSEVIAMSQGNNIEKLAEEGTWLIVTTTDDKELKTNIGALNYNDLRELGLNAGVKYEIKPGGIDWGSLLISFLPLVLFGGLLFFLLFRARGANNQALSFGRSRARLSAPDKPAVTFEDVAAEPRKYGSENCRKKRWLRAPISAFRFNP